MLKHSEISDTALREMIQQKDICLGGNAKLKIYGTLHCPSGKRMKRESRVFFVSEQEALEFGYRPCGHCMKKKYREWIYRIHPQ